MTALVTPGHADPVRGSTGPIGATSRPRRILALDGGGMRCLIGVEILVALEKRLAELTGDPQCRLHRHFDLVAGTSGGAIVGAAIALGRPMHEIRDFVVDNAARMFKRARFYRLHRSRYDMTHLEASMKEWFGASTLLGSPELRTLLLVVMRNWSTDSPWIVSNSPTTPYNRRELDDCNLDIPLWQLTRASAAAPAYYTPETICLGKKHPKPFVFVDGGMTGLLNPAFKAFQFVTTGAYGLNWSTGEDALTIVSVGAGEARHHHERATADRLNILLALRGVPSALLSATVREQDLLCRLFGRCRTGASIDTEVGDLHSGSTAVEPRLFAYHRLNPRIDREGLRDLGCADLEPSEIVRIDAVKQVNAYTRIGRAFAAKAIERVAQDCLVQETIA